MSKYIATRLAETTINDGNKIEYSSPLFAEDINALAEGILYNNGQCDINTLVLKSSFGSFPNIGNEYTMYVDDSQNKLYRWDKVEMKYFCIGSNYEEIELINCGNAEE